MMGLIIIRRYSVWWIYYRSLTIHFTQNIHNIINVERNTCLNVFTLQKYRLHISLCISELNGNKNTTKWPKKVEVRQLHRLLHWQKSASTTNNRDFFWSYEGLVSLEKRIYIEYLSYSIIWLFSDYSNLINWHKLYSILI